MNQKMIRINHNLKAHKTGYFIDEWMKLIDERKNKCVKTLKKFDD